MHKSESDVILIASCTAYTRGNILRITIGRQIL